MISETNSRGFEATFSYDNVGNIKNKTDFNGSQFTYGYKANNLLKRVDIINGFNSKALSYEYDEAGGLMSSTDDSVVTKYNFFDDGNGSTVYQPDPFDKILRITTELDGKSYNIDYDYDSAGRVKNITYPTAHSVGSTYKQFGQLASLGDYIDGSISYYNNGLLNGYRLSNGVNYSSSYDADNRLTGFNYVDGASASLDSYVFGYDDSNNIINKVVNGKTNSYTWDALNQLIRADNQGEFEVDPSKLDMVQKVGAVTEDYVGQKSLDFTVDDTELRLDYNSISIGFDIGSDTKLNKLVIKPENVVNRLHKNKLALYISSDNSNWSILDRDAWSFEVKDDVIVLALTSSIATRYVKVHCFFDDRDDRGFARDLAEVRNKRDSLLTAYFTVDRMVEGFQYDDAGNREEYSVNYSNGSGYTSNYTYYANSNLIKSDGKFAYVWDRNGNLVEKSDDYTITNNNLTLSTDSGNYTKYTYDLLNRLIKVELSEKGSGNISKEVSYVYDHRGYRLKRVGSDSNDVTYYSFGLNGEVLYKENQSRDKFEEYIYLFGKHFAKEVGKLSEPTNRKRLYYHTDHLGSTISITDTNGDRVWSNNYTSFGNSTNEKGLLDELANYTSKEIDPETGLYYFNARWYDPEMGRFITEDPIKDGNNWYVYCGNNPLTFIDPTGLVSYRPTGASKFAINQISGANKGRGKGSGSGNQNSSEHGEVYNKINLEQPETNHLTTEDRVRLLEDGLRKKEEAEKILKDSDIYKQLKAEIDKVIKDNNEKDKDSKVNDLTIIITLIDPDEDGNIAQGQYNPKTPNFIYIDARSDTYAMVTAITHETQHAYNNLTKNGKTEWASISDSEMYENPELNRDEVENLSLEMLAIDAEVRVINELRNHSINGNIHSRGFLSMNNGTSSRVNFTNVRKVQPNLYVKMIRDHVKEVYKNKL